MTMHAPVLRSGRAMRTYTVARALAAGGGLDLLFLRFEGDGPDASFSAIDGVRMHAVASTRSARRIAVYAGNRARGMPAPIARGVSPELAAAAADLADAAGRRRVIADGPIAAATLAPLARRRPVIYNAHNFESGFRHELDGSDGQRRQRALRAFERRLLERAQETWMVSDADMAAARELCPGARLRYVPNVVDVTAIEPVRPAREEQRAIFVANYEYKPNRDGLRFMLEQVLPRVWAQLPHARLTLAGAGLEHAPSADPRVETLGFVEDLHAAYASASCAVVPLLVGGGTPLKLIEALAHGLPVIATPRAAAGLALTDGVDCVIADGADAYAAALVRVLSDGAEEIARRGRALAAQRYSIETLTALLAE